MSQAVQPFGAFLQCYKNPFATFVCIQSVRRFYPDSTIVLLSDDGYDYTEMAKHFNCIYIHCKDKANFNHKDLDSGSHVKNSNKLINRFYHAYSLIKEDYVLLLEDDVIMNRPITQPFEFDINGNCVNFFQKYMVDEFAKKYPYIDLTVQYCYSGAGGSIMHRKNMMKYMENKEVIRDLLENWKNYNLTIDICQDFLFSCIVRLNNGTIGWHYETNDGFNTICNHLAVQHQFKLLYGVPMPDEIKHLVKIT
jgi:hypothetical protein